MTAECSKCSAVVGEPCRYVAGRWLNSQGSWTSPGSHAKGRLFTANPGDPMPTVHPERKAAIRERRLWQYRHAVLLERDRERRAKQMEYQRERKRAMALLRGPSDDARAARAAMPALDVAEYEALVTWWRENGHLLVNADKS